MPELEETDLSGLALRARVSHRAPSAISPRLTQKRQVEVVSCRAKVGSVASAVPRAARRLSCSASNQSEGSPTTGSPRSGSWAAAAVAYHSRCRCRHTATSSASLSRASAYWRTTSSNRYRVSGPVVSACTSDLSTSREITGMIVGLGSSQTDAAA